MEDRTRAAHPGGLSTGKRAEDFWDDVFERLYKPSLLSVEAFATLHCKECSEKPLARKQANGQMKVFAHKTIENEMNLRLRE